MDALGNGFGLASFLCFYAWIGAGCIDKRDYWKSKTLCHTHKALGLAIPLRLGHAKVMLDPGFCVVAALMPNYNYRLAVKASKAATDGPVISKVSIPCQRNVVFDKFPQIVDAVWPRRETGNLYLLRRGKPAVGKLKLLFQF